MLKTICFTLAAVFAGAAAAQTSARPDPADAKAAAPARPYQSAYKDYRRYADPEVARWRDVNDEMRRLGGHSGHLKPDPGAAAEPRSNPQVPARHGAHK